MCYHNSAKAKGDIKMTRNELILKIDEMIKEAHLKAEQADKDNDLIIEAINVGKEQGLLWAKIYALELE